MSGDVWEHMVEMWLTRDRAIFVSPSYLVGEPGHWEACVDFLAVDFREQAIWAVEVTAAAGFGKIKKKAAEFDEQYATRIRDQLNHDGLRMVDLMGWSIGLWAFVRKDYADACAVHLSKSVKTSQVTALEDTTAPWDYWPKRHHPVPAR